VCCTLFAAPAAAIINKPINACSLSLVSLSLSLSDSFMAACEKYTLGVVITTDQIEAVIIHHHQQQGPGMGDRIYQ